MTNPSPRKPSKAWQEEPTSMAVTRGVKARAAKLRNDEKGIDSMDDVLEMLLDFYEEKKK
jgi:hypothetical protein